MRTNDSLGVGKAFLRIRKREIAEQLAQREASRCKSELACLPSEGSMFPSFEAGQRSERDEIAERKGNERVRAKRIHLQGRDQLTRLKAATGLGETYQKQIVTAGKKDQSSI